MPPKPGNAFAQQKEMERRTSQLQEHSREVSHDTTSSTRNVRVNTYQDPQKESSARVSAQDMPDTPRTTMAMFTEDLAPEDSQETSPERSEAMSMKTTKKRKQKAGSKQSSSPLRADLPTSSSTMHTPLALPRQTGLDFIKSTFTRGKRAFTKTTPSPALETQNVFAPYNFQQRNNNPQQAVQQEIHTAVSDLRNTDPAVLYARAHTLPEPDSYVSYVPSSGNSQALSPSSRDPAITLQKSAFASTHIPPTTSEQSAASCIQVPATKTQDTGPSHSHGSPHAALQRSPFRDHSPADRSQQLASTVSSHPATASHPLVPSSMKIPQSAIPDRYRISAGHSQRESTPPLFRPHTGMMPYSHSLPRHQAGEAHLSSATQQSQATSQTQYTFVNRNEGIILGTSISPTRQGTYAITGNAELVSRPSVMSLTGIVSEVSPTTQGPQQQGLLHSGPFISSHCQPRLNAPLPSLPASASEDQPANQTPTTLNLGRSAGNTGSVQGDRNPAVVGTWERMQAQYPHSMPQLSPAPQYIAQSTSPTAFLYNFNASEDTKSEGQKSDLEEEHEDDGTSKIQRLLRRSGLRRAFSNNHLNLSHRISSPGREALFMSSPPASEAMTPPAAPSLAAPPATSNAASCPSPAPSVTTHGPPRHPHHHNTTTFGGPAPTPPHPSYQPLAPASQQMATAFSVLHHRLERDNRVLQEHVSRSIQSAQDRLMVHMDERVAALVGRVGELEGEVAALRQQLGGRGGASGAGAGAGLVAEKKREKGRGKERKEEKGEKGEEEEVLWRRPVRGALGEIGGRWYEAEVGRK